MTPRSPREAVFDLVNYTFCLDIHDPRRLREAFETVKYVKPASSRKDSAEVFLVALNKR